MTFWVAGAVVGSAVISSNAARKAAKEQSGATTQAMQYQTDAGERAARIQADAATRAAELQSNATREAAQIQQRVADAQMALEREQFNRQVELQQPFRTAGVNALNQLVPLASNYTPFGMEQFQADPGYSFRMDEGMKALERSAAARGGLLSGSAMKGIQRFGQGLASDEYANAFNRYQTERNARLNPLQSLAGVGQTATQQIGQAGQAMTSGMGQTGQSMAANLGNLYTSGASNLGNIATSSANNLGNIYTSTAANNANALMSGAAARASGYVGQANALTSALNTGLNFYQGQQMMNMMNTPQGFNYSPGRSGYNYTYQNPSAVGPFQP